MKIDMIIIDPTICLIEKRPIEVQSPQAIVSTLNNLVSGQIECIFRFENYDVFFIDTDALDKDPQHFFTFDGIAHPLAGKGVILNYLPHLNYFDGPVTAFSKILGAINFLELKDLMRLKMPP